ncbi:MAG TPA: response regulator FixJ [Stellaceae bacterium]|nr:response regulator FixJ [Stellaceae bacterium]
MSANARIFIVDDDDAVRDSLELLLRAAGFEAIVAYASARNFLAEAAPMPGECLLLDVRMPDMDGLELQEELNRRGIKLPVIIMTGHGDVPIAVRAMKAGAMDFIEKPFSDELLVDCVRRARRQAEEARREGAEADEVRHRLQILTPRERDVLQGMIAGQPNKLIAHALGISPRTVEIHRARVMDKMAARSLSALVRMALAAGIESN